MIHVLGKDIAKFHCIYWPAFLSAGEYELPKQTIVHGHWKKDNLKMSKSIGNIVDPFDLIDRHGINAVRSYLLVSGPQLKDSNFETSGLYDLHDKLLIDGFINMFFRCTGRKFKIQSCKLENIEFTSEDMELIQKVKSHTYE